MLSTTGTFSKGQDAWGFENNLVVTSADGVTVGLSDGRFYTDWVSGLGTNLLGYGYLKEQITAELNGGGGSLSLPHRLEYVAAEKLAALLATNIPHWNGANLGVRFALSGTDAVAMAVRLARAVTGRDGVMVLKGGYHGWADWTIARTEPAAGIPSVLAKYIKEFDFNDLESFRGAALSSEIDTDEPPAAIVIEQGLAKPDPTFYPAIRRFCDYHGSLLIMDEVVTGLRYALGGACQLYGIKPDLVCMGKGLGSGQPISALVGGQALMAEFSKISPVFCSSTHWGNSLDLAAAVAVLEAWDDTKVSYIWRLGDRLMSGLRQAGWPVIGDPPRSLVTSPSIEERAFFIHGMREEGFLMNRPNFPSFSHTEALVDQTIEAAARVRAKYQAALERGTLAEKMAGKLPKVLFSDR